MDIYQFIGKVNSLADMANITKAERKIILYEYMLAGINPQLLREAKDPTIPYESFTSFVANLALNY